MPNVSGCPICDTTGGPNGCPIHRPQLNPLAAPWSWLNPPSPPRQFVWPTRRPWDGWGEVVATRTPEPDTGSPNPIRESRVIVGVDDHQPVIALVRLLGGVEERRETFWFTRAEAEAMQEAFARAIERAQAEWDAINAQAETARSRRPEQV